MSLVLEMDNTIKKIKTENISESARQHPITGDGVHTSTWGNNTGEGSGQIWSKSNLPLDISAAQQKELELAWVGIPKKYTDGISALRIMIGCGNAASGSYNSIGNYVNVRVGNIDGVGAASVLYHEVHHHLWYTKRTYVQLDEWRTGVLKIMSDHDMSPTRYSDTFAPKRELKRLEKMRVDLSKHRKDMDSGRITIELCYPTYKKLKRTISADIRWARKTYREVSDVTRRMETKLYEMKAEYDSLSDAGRMQKAKINYKEKEGKISEHVSETCYREIFFNEAHSETGSYIHAEKSMRERSALYNPKHPKWDHRINEGVIEKYVALYRQVFAE